MSARSGKSYGHRFDSCRRNEICMSSATYIMGRTNRPMEHILRKPVESRRAYQQRRKTIAFAIVLALGITFALVVLLAGCGSVGGNPSTSGAATLTPAAT